MHPHCLLCAALLFIAASAPGAESRRATNIADLRDSAAAPASPATATPAPANTGPQAAAGDQAPEATPTPPPTAEIHTRSKAYIAIVNDLNRAEDEAVAGVLFDMAEAAYGTLVHLAATHGLERPACQHRVDPVTIASLDRKLTPAEQVQVRRWRKAQIDRACAGVSWQ